MTFTSENDYTGSPSSAQPGDWGGVDFQSGSAGGVTYAVFDFGGNNVNGSSGVIYTELTIEGPASQVAVSHSQFNNSYGTGVELASNASISLTSDSFAYCTVCGYGDSSSHAIRFDFVPGNLTNAGTPLLSGLTSTGSKTTTSLSPAGTCRRPPRGRQPGWTTGSTET